ncbi:hypothetical protein, partial [Serratia fonticola]
ARVKAKKAAQQAELSQPQVDEEPIPTAEPEDPRKAAVAAALARVKAKKAAQQLAMVDKE